METSDYIAHLQREGGRLADVTAASDLDRPVPACPSWTVRAVVRHTGRIHRWARSHITDHRDSPADVRETAGPMPGDEDLVGWYRENLQALVDTLESASDDDRFWHFGPDPNRPRGFWARRQALETAVHRTDVESASQGITPIESALAADGIDETFDVFVLPRDRLRSATPLTLHLHASDAGRDWVASIGPDSVELRRAPAAAGCTVSGPASDLYLLLWNRLDRNALDIDGDPAVLDLWRAKVRVTMTGDLE
jgi:uncharacterized protein (TIGR03083 family)